VIAWPDGRPRVLVTDGWFTNAGDAAIAVATERLVRQHAPGAAVLHAAYGAEVVGDRYPELSFAPPLDALLGSRWSAGSAEGRELVAGADLVVSQGGGFLREEYEPWTRLDALEQVVAMDLPLLLLGQTIGRFDLAFARRALGTVLRGAVGVVVREEASGHHAVDLGADPAAVVLGADLALVLARDRPRVRRAAGPDAPVAVVLTDHVVERDRPERLELAAEVLSAAVRGHPDRRIEVWSSAQGAGEDRDEHVADLAVEALAPKERERVVQIRAHVDADELLARTRDAAAVVSMRFHPALLAVAQGTPGVLLLDDQKAAAAAGTSLDRGTLADISRPRTPDLGGLPTRLVQAEAVLAKQLASPGARP
jgi:polysaccharide pyruvyl transferase WcaK-like protein